MWACVSVKGIVSPLLGINLLLGAHSSPRGSERPTLQQIRTSAWKAFALLCVGLAWALPGSLLPSLPTVLPPLCVSLPLCVINTKSRQHSSQNSLCPSLRDHYEITVLPLASVIWSHWSTVYMFSKCPSSLLNNLLVDIQWPRLKANQWLRSFFLDPCLLLEVTPTLRLIPVNYFNFLCLDLRTH